MASNEILMISSFPPRKCGIATYTQDLINAIEGKYDDDLQINICALQKSNRPLKYPSEVTYFLKTWLKEDYKRLALEINGNKNIKVIYLQHEFGLFGGKMGIFLLDFLENLDKAVITTFHTVLKEPCEERKVLVQKIAALSSGVIAMTNLSVNILKNDYSIFEEKIKMIPHGSHLIETANLASKDVKKFKGKTIISTFGLISAGKGIETALDALPKITAKFPNVLYLIIGKTHPEVVKNEGEIYREFLHQKVKNLKLQNNVLFINKYLDLDSLLAHLQRTDIYFFTSKDPQQAVSGTLVYALSAGCPVVSTPIPHSLELLDGAGINFDFGNAPQLADATILMLSNPDMMQEMRLNAIHRISPSSWQNSAIAHVDLAQDILDADRFDENRLEVNFKIPEINLKHIQRMTSDFGFIQFAKISDPDLSSGYTVDDNARALIAVAKHFKMTGDFNDLRLVDCYLKFILFCQQEDGSFLNYVTNHHDFFDKNKDENLEDANGRAIWALGEFLSYKLALDSKLQAQIENAFQKAIPTILKLKSPRAISFCIKGLHYYNQFKKEESILQLITQLADNLVSKYRGISNEKWQWYEDYLTYANAVIPEAMLLAGVSTQSELYKNTALKTFDFLLHTTFSGEKIKVISNQGWHHKGKDKKHFGEQPIEITYTILALNSFYKTFKKEKYLEKMNLAFEWFLGDNHLRQIIYNPVTGGCYDGLEEKHINLNQGAESSICYLLARLTVENYREVGLSSDKMENIVETNYSSDAIYAEV
jgi:glycosyltransferase involved in cell wall biosynthesis